MAVGNPITAVHLSMHPLDHRVRRSGELGVPCCKAKETLLGIGEETKESRCVREASSCTPPEREEKREQGLFDAGDKQASCMYNSIMNGKCLTP